MASSSPSQDDIDSLLQRVRERFQMALAPAALSRLPLEVLKDTTLNLSRSLDSELSELSRGDRVLIALGTAYALGSKEWVEWLSEAALASKKTQADIEAAKAVALTCSTYNGYYKFRALMDSPTPSPFQPALRATPFLQSALSKLMIELLCVTVSVQNSCSHCLQGHVQAAKTAGATEKMLDEAVRIGAVFGALANVE